MNKVTIILPSYNHVSFLDDRLDSIVNQTYSNWKIIIIDDCSTDGSIKILKKFNEKYKSKIEEFIINEKNTGSGYTSWYTGVKMAKSEYIWIAETDDYSDINFLEEMVNTLEANKNVALAFCSSKYVNTNKEYWYNSNKRTEDLKVEGTYGVLDGKKYVDKMPFNTYITNGSSVVFRKPNVDIPKELFSYKQCSDIFFWTFLLQKKKFIFLNKELNYFRRHENSTSEKISIHKKQSVYFEKASFLNYFKLQNRSKDFIKHYIKYYINLNKKNVLKIKPILKIEGVKFLKYYYLISLIKFYLNKLKSRYVSKS